MQIYEENPILYIKWFTYQGLINLVQQQCIIIFKYDKIYEQTIDIDILEGFQIH